MARGKMGPSDTAGFGSTPMEWPATWMVVGNIGGKTGDADREVFGHGRIDEAGIQGQCVHFPQHLHRGVGQLLAVDGGGRGPGSRG